MKCPHCGAEIPEGYMLCEKCGTEIQIVPDFDTEVENSITETLTNIVEGLNEAGLLVPDPEEEKPAEPKQKGKEGKRKKTGKMRWLILFIFIPILIAIGFLIYISVTEYLNSPEYQMKRAERLSLRAITGMP